MLNLAGAVLLDPSSGTAMSQDHQYLAQAIYDRYPGFRLAQIPVSERVTVEEKEYPFALIHEDSGQVVKHFRDDELNINTVFRWLYENDSAVHGQKKLYENFLEEQRKQNELKRKASEDQLKQDTEFVHFLATNQKHTIKHNGKKYGA